MEEPLFSQNDNSDHRHFFVYDQFQWSNPIHHFLQYPGDYDLNNKNFKRLYPETIGLNQAVFHIETHVQSFFVAVIQQEECISVYCNCNHTGGNLCEQQLKVISALVKQEELQLFFNAKLRYEKLKKKAYDFGLEKETNLDQHFKIAYSQNKLIITPVQSGLLSVTQENLEALRTRIVPNDAFSLIETSELENNENFIVLKKHKYYKCLQIELYNSKRTKEGKIKNPLSLLNPEDYLWNATDANEMKFFMGINKFQKHSGSKVNESDLVALRAIIKNPLDYPFYGHNTDISESVTAASLSPLQVRIFSGDFSLTVKKQGGVYEIYAQLLIDDCSYRLKDLPVKYGCFLLIGEIHYLIDKLPVLKIINLLKQNSDKLLVHEPKFKEFKTELLDKLEDKIKIDYSYIKNGTPNQLFQNGFGQEVERIIYLSDFGSQVMIIPVMRYGEVEVSVRTKRQVYGIDQLGKDFLVRRNEKEEAEFISLLIKQHIYFEEQLENDLYYFYLHKKHFLNEDWFLNTFEEWANNKVEVLGFNEIEGNKLSPYKAKIDIKVLSGLNWFNANINVGYGKKKASLKKLQLAVKNKSKYVVLDDGTKGIIPTEWIEKFSNYFSSGEVLSDETIGIPKVNFSAIEAYYEPEMLEESVRRELELYRRKVGDFTSIEQVEVPAGLNAELRTYQKEGLNWLNFLDSFNFGGCLADEMGLGKSIQIIAFILLQREKVNQNTNLLVVPATLVFNWKAEIEKFAPQLKVHTLAGGNRIKSTADFDQYEVILTSYNTLLTDVNFIKNYQFNYIFLDESQQIKNPESQRYNAVCLLKSRNKIAITGTPIENNTFDLYSMLSFACPGLLGSKSYFRDIYSIPIDRFQDSRRARELQHKIQPFLLRRTKQQVAKELPDKTEMVLYCEMKEDQRKVYNAYEKEFRDYISATNDEEIRKSPMNVLKGLTKLRQICNSTRLLNKEDLLLEGASSKIETLMEQVEDNAYHSKILIFSQFVSMLQLIKAELVKRKIGFSILTGSTRDRESVVKDFQNNDDIRVFLISLKAGGTGLNLVEANYVYLVDPWWNPAVENQAIDRSHRIGQSKNVTAIRLVCPNTVEEKMMKLQESKRELANNLIKEEASYFPSFSKQELLELLQ